MSAGINSDHTWIGEVKKIDERNSNYSCNLIFFYFCVQFKKSGKEPKAGAELVFGNTVYKTKVWN